MTEGRLSRPFYVIGIRFLGDRKDKAHVPENARPAEKQVNEKNRAEIRVPAECANDCRQKINRRRQYDICDQSTFHPAILKEHGSVVKAKDLQLK